MISTAEFFSLSDFAIEAHLANGTTVNGIFDEDAATVLGVDTTGPAFTCSAEVLKANDVIEINGKSFRVAARLQGDSAVVTWAVQKL